MPHTCRYQKRNVQYKCFVSGCPKYFQNEEDRKNHLLSHLSFSLCLKFYENESKSNVAPLMGYIQLPVPNVNCSRFYNQIPFRKSAQFSDLDPDEQFFQQMDKN